MIPIKKPDLVVVAQAVSPALRVEAIVRGQIVPSYHEDAIRNGEIVMRNAQLVLESRDVIDALLKTNDSQTERKARDLLLRLKLACR